MIVDGRWGDDNGGRLRWLLMGGGALLEVEYGR